MDAVSLRRGSPLPTAREDDEVTTPTSAYSTLRSSRRQSTLSELSVWYDAPEFDGAEEFILEDQPAEDSLGSQFSEALSTGLASASSTSGFSSNSTSDSDSNSGDETPNDIETADTSETSPSQEQVIVRRTQLPSPVVGDEGSLFAVLKKNVGKVSIAVQVLGCISHSCVYLGPCSSYVTGVL
jgi:oxysterol-binding protein-related protein 3/6/7